MRRYLYPGLLYAIAVGLVAAGWPPGASPLLAYGGLAAYPVATLFWVFTALRAGPPRLRQAGVALVPAILPVAFTVLALSYSDASVLGIIGNWPITLLSPIICLCAAAVIAFWNSEEEGEPRSQTGPD